MEGQAAGAEFGNLYNQSLVASFLALHGEAETEMWVAGIVAAESVGVFFLDQGGSGTHINICGIDLVKDAPNAAAAMQLGEHTLSVPAQETLSAGNFEFPVNPKAAKAPLLASWEDFQAQSVDFADLNRFKTRAKEILDASSRK